jgi:hypothetical protein
MWRIQIAKRIAKFVLIGLMLVGIVFSMFNFMALKSSTAVFWQILEMGTDPVTGGPYIKCWKTGSTCCSVIYPYDGQ